MQYVDAISAAGRSLRGRARSSLRFRDAKIAKLFSTIARRTAGDHAPPALPALPADVIRAKRIQAAAAGTIRSAVGGSAICEACGPPRFAFDRPGNSVRPALMILVDGVPYCEGEVTDCGFSVTAEVGEVGVEEG